MACRLFGAKPLPEPMLSYCQLDPQEQISVNFDSNYEHFIDQNALENFVWEMAAILSRGRWANRVYIKCDFILFDYLYCDDLFSYD